MTELTDNERMMQRVQDLLDKVEDFRRHGEDGSAETAFAKANEIMMKHAIDAAVIAARRAAASLPIDEKIVQRVVEFKGIYRTALALAFHPFVRAYTNTVRTFTAKTSKIEHLYLVGYESEVEQLRMVIVSVHLQAAASVKLWWQARSPGDRGRTAMEQFKTRREYMSNFVGGATDRVALARRTALGESASGTELALRDRRSAVDEFVAANYRLFDRRTNLKPGSIDAATAGRAAGQRANTGDTPLPGRRRQLEA